MLNNILPPGPSTEIGKTIKVSCSGTQIFWHNSNKVITYDCS